MSVTSCSRGKYNQFRTADRKSRESAYCISAQRIWHLYRNEYPSYNEYCGPLTSIFEEVARESSNSRGLWQLKLLVPDNQVTRRLTYRFIVTRSFWRQAHRGMYRFQDTSYGGNEIRVGWTDACIPTHSYIFLKTKSMHCSWTLVPRVPRVPLQGPLWLIHFIVISFLICQVWEGCWEGFSTPQYFKDSV